MLASSIIIVCRPRPQEAPLATRRELVQALQRELPEALRNLQHGNIAPVDLPQSAIGPGMAIFSRYARVVEADGAPMSVRTALQLINQQVDEFLSEQEASLDDWTRFAVTWFSQYGFKPGKYGEAETIAVAKGVAVDGAAGAGLLESGGGKVRLLRLDELSGSADVSSARQVTVLGIVHQLSRTLEEHGAEGAAALLRQGGGGDARALCYRLYTLCEQHKWADEARPYNTLIAEWPELTRLGERVDQPTPQQATLF